jgi:NodT family efflux transporter outer membrane factor (OMF) lipoprotein
MAIGCGLLVISSGCGIPGLRRAQSGPALPQYYNWNNGAGFANPDPASAPSYATHSTDPADSTAPAGFYESYQANNANAAADQVAVHFEDSQPSAKQSQDASTEIAESPEPKKHTKLFDIFKRVSHDRENRNDPLPQADNTSGPGISADEAFLTNVSLNDPSFIEADPSQTDNSDTSSNSVAASIDSAMMLGENSARSGRDLFFDDPYLLGLIHQGLTGNQELRILFEEIQIARNEVYARSGEYRPFVTLGAGAGIEKSGERTREGAVEGQLEGAPGEAFPDPLPDFLVATNISWELDIWRKLRNAQCAAAMRYLGTQEGRNYVVTRLVAEIAENYYRLLALDNRMLTLEQTIAIQEQSLEVAQAKKDAGRGTELAVQRFQAEVRKNQSERSIIAQEIVEVENRINFLVGRYPQQVERTSVEFIDMNLNSLSAGVPSELLRNRADIRQAERMVSAAGLDVCVARARFYPSLTLTGGLGWNAFSTGYLFQTPESLIYGMAAELVGPLINKRAIQAAYQSANAAQLQSIFEYQQTILTAHIEVVNLMTKVENYRRSIEVKKEQLSALEASVESANQLFQNARAEYVEVLLAQREMMEAKMLLIDTKQEQLSAIVNAYQALGGGGF